MVSVSVGDSSTSSRPVTNGEGGGLFQKHSKFSGSTTAYGSGGVNAQIQQRNSNSTGNGSKYGTISTTDVERREVSKNYVIVYI